MSLYVPMKMAVIVTVVASVSCSSEGEDRQQTPAAEHYRQGHLHTWRVWS